MKRRIILIVFLVIGISAATVGALYYVQGPIEAKPPSMQTQRLFGTVHDGIDDVSTAGGPLYYGFHPGFTISNPDLDDGKTLEKIVVYDGDNGVIVKEINLSGEEAWLGPHEIFARDFRRLEIEPPVGQYTAYTIEVYWHGGGLPLVGWAGIWSYEVEQGSSGEWEAVDFGPFAYGSPMMNYTD
ncbi:MAG: hypothetical protein MUP73_07335 [Dehalococcoidia bacterium]|nr:hypothetical protein [Dehalococcoidia bacterium]